MLFLQKVHPLNFEYVRELSVHGDGVRIAGSSFAAQIRCDEIGNFCTRLRLRNDALGNSYDYSDGICEGYRQGHPVPPQLDGERARFEASHRIEVAGAELTIRFSTGLVLKTVSEGIGFNGDKTIVNFDVTHARGFYGFGERTGSLNKRGESMQFWNVDVVLVFPHTYARDDYDPAYVAIPLVILKVGKEYCGLYFDNPGRTLMDVEQMRQGQLIYQAMTGNTDVYLIAGPGLRDVVRGFTKLTGCAEVPPLWSMGYHQCRWGYRTEADLLELKEKFEQFDIPVSVLWYDIDYMEGYRLFTWDREAFPDPAGLNRRLKEAGIRSVAIIDPGVKRDPGYPVYDSGKAQGVFCKTASGRDYVGRVWPGDCVFPDFSQTPVRVWWAGWMARFVQESALDGVWLDMNDPATGYSLVEDMRFQNGTVSHEAYHNQYGHYMAKASREAFDLIDPNARPFLLTRSGFTGTQRYSAIWTGDNASNWRHLRMSIPCTLNLGLSGVAFNGPDVGGFMGNTTEALLIRWYQAAFLFPFFRNHSMQGSKTQEPWAFGSDCLAHVRATIRARYRLLPYLYQCFCQHYLTGDPILRPLLYEFEGPGYEDLSDQFLVGSSIMVAPILHGDGEGEEVLSRGKRCQRRYISIPPGWWFDLNRGEWVEGGQTLRYAAALDEVPMFVGDGAIIPYDNGLLSNRPADFDRIELHVFSRGGTARFDYVIDDRETRGYQDGVYNTAAINAEIGDHEIELKIAEEGPYPKDTVTFSPVLYGHPGEWRARVEGNGQARRSVLKASTREWVCKRIDVRA